MKRPNITRTAAALAALIITFAISSCRKGGINGDLDGQWRVIAVEHLADGTVSEPYNHFYCLYLHTANLTNPGVAATANMTYDRKGRRLTLEFPDGAEHLAPWGIYDITTTFTIEHLNSHSLVIVSDKARVTMKKF